MPSRLDAFLLRSPLHRLRSGGHLLLEVGGRSVVLPYASGPGDAVTVLGKRGEAWWEALDREGPTPVSLRLAGREVAGRARFAAGDELDEALVGYLQRHPGAWSTLGVAGNATEEDLAAAAKQAAVVVIDLDA